MSYTSKIHVEAIKLITGLGIFTGRRRRVSAFFSCPKTWGKKGACPPLPHPEAHEFKRSRTESQGQLVEVAIKKAGAYSARRACKLRLNSEVHGGV